MKRRNLMFLIGMFLIGITNAQENTTASGGDISGTGGSASYSIGQVFYTYETGGNASLSQGVQVPYEITIVDGVVENGVNLDMVAFPVPTQGILNLYIADYKGEPLTYQVFNTIGKLIELDRVSNNNTEIDLSKQPTGTYIVCVIGKKNSIKTFKVIKN